MYTTTPKCFEMGKDRKAVFRSSFAGHFSQKLEEAEIDPSDADRLMYIINYMATELLYPMLELEQPENECGDYLSEIRPLYLSGSVAPSPAERHRYACMIFDILEN